MFNEEGVIDMALAPLFPSYHWHEYEYEVPRYVGTLLLLPIATYCHATESQPAATPNWTVSPIITGTGIQREGKSLLRCEAGSAHQIHHTSMSSTSTRVYDHFRRWVSTFSFTGIEPNKLATLTFQLHQMPSYLVQVPCFAIYHPHSLAGVEKEKRGVSSS